MLVILLIFAACLGYGVIQPYANQEEGGLVLIAGFGELILGFGLCLLIFKEERVVVR